MNIQQALYIIEDIQADMGEGLLETLMYMQDNLDQFSDTQVRAFRLAMADFRKMFATA